MSGTPDIDPWLVTVSRLELHVTVITRAEIRYGLARLPAGRHRADLTIRVDRFLGETRDKLLPFDASAADRYSELVAKRQDAGRPMSVPDVVIASIFWVHRARPTTRNVRDFADSGIEVIDPYDW